MKKFAMAAAMLLVAMMSLGSVTAFAAEAPETSRPHERPAFSDRVNTPRGGAVFGRMWKGKGREKVGLTDEERAAMIEAGSFPFIGKSFSGMNDRKPKNMGNFMPGMPAFSGKNFKSVGKCPMGEIELTAEQKAALMESIKSSLGDEFPSGKLMMPQMAAPGMMNSRIFKAAAVPGLLRRVCQDAGELPSAPGLHPGRHPGRSENDRP